MARLASEGKGGFYPTPPEEMNHILKVLSLTEKAKQEGITIIDPCCGEGDALKQIAEHFTPYTSVRTYGIELEKDRAAVASTKVDNVLACGYEEVKMSYDAFSIMYLNPPFMEVQGTRFEKIMLEDLSENHIASGSLLILNIPQNVLTHVAQLLASRFVNIRAFRFSDENGNYERYKQVIVFAVRRRKGLRTPEEREYKEKIEKDLKELAYTGKALIPILSNASKFRVTYEIDAPVKPVQLFKSMLIEEKDVLASVDRINHYNKVMSKMSSLEITSSIRNIRPALPLKTTHIAAAINAGALPENMGTHMLVGVTKRIQEQRIEVNSKTDKMQEVITFKPKSIVRVFSDKGIFNLK